MLMSKSNYNNEANSNRSLLQYMIDNDLAIVTGEMPEPEVDPYAAKREVIRKICKAFIYKNSNFEMTVTRYGRAVSVRLSYSGTHGDDFETISKILSKYELPSIDEMKSYSESCKEQGKPEFLYTLNLTIKRPQ